jgi:hypothetical protein
MTDQPAAPPRDPANEALMEALDQVSPRTAAYILAEWLANHEDVPYKAVSGEQFYIQPEGHGEGVLVLSYEEADITEDLP